MAPTAATVNDIRKLNFEKCALASGLLTVQQLEEVRASLRGSSGGPAAPEAFEQELSDNDLSDKIVALGLLNPWQAKQLLDGKTKFNLGQYRIVDSLGQGGMGHVFKAEDPLLKRMVAIKVLPRDRTTPEAIANFTREIRALSSLRHPKLVRAVDAGNDGNVHYLVTEYVPGADLRKLVRRSGPLSMEAAANIISQIAEGLQHAHQEGIVHRDVKPGNVLVTPEGDAKLSDLGLAGPMTNSAEDDPRHGKIVGTADYLSPDHIMSPWDPKPSWDIYSLGCTLYYATTGKVPFPGGTTSDKARAHCSMKPLDPRRLNHQLSDPFVDLIADLMAKDPAQRISTAAEAVERLAPWATKFQKHRSGAPAMPGTLGPVGAEPPPRATPPGGYTMPAPPLAATPLAPLGELPAMPGPLFLPPAPPPDQRFAAAYGEAPVAPPPVISPPIAEWEWDSPSGGESPVLIGESPLRDTLPDLPAGLETSSDSDSSIRLIVEPPRRMPLWLLMALVLAPVVIAGLVLLALWFRDAALSGTP
jgi:serine/threonine protein kinase